jgi:hypothetical protein
MEELRAELRHRLCLIGAWNSNDIPQHAVYLASWIKPVKEDDSETGSAGLVSV